MKLNPAMEIVKDTMEKQVAVKHDGDKLRMDLLPETVLRELARAYTVGAKKYGDYNWRNGMEWSRLVAACRRHLSDWLLGETYAQDDGQHHLAAAMWNLATLMEYERLGIGEDDRVDKDVLGDSNNN